MIVISGVAAGVERVGPAVLKEVKVGKNIFNPQKLNFSRRLSTRRIAGCLSKSSSSLPDIPAAHAQEGGTA